MKISKALSTAGGNFARPTKYNMLLTVPSSLAGISGITYDVLCKTIQKPSEVQEPYEIKLKGHTLKVPGRTNQSQELTVTFYVDEFYTIHTMLHKWVQKTDDLNLMGFSSDDKFGSIELIARDFNETGAAPARFIFEDVFPLNIGEIDYNTSDKDTISEISVTFAYSRYTVK
jgi:hypothetical protein